MSNTFAGVVGLVNRLQRACGALGEHAGSSDIATSVPNLWNLLPSVVVIGGQVGTYMFKLRRRLAYMYARSYVALDTKHSVRGLCGCAHKCPELRTAVVRQVFGAGGGGGHRLPAPRRR